MSALRMHRRHLGRMGLVWVLPALWLAGCAQPEKPPIPTQAFWSGRIQLRVDDPTDPKNLLALFTLQGSAQQGTLDLTSPLGTVLARLEWSPGQAQLHTPHEQRSATTLDTLLQEALQTSLPLDALFDWLAGLPTAATGWEVDLQALDQGRLTARRTSPLPAATLRILLSR